MTFKSNAKYGEPVESGTIYRGRIGGLEVSFHRIIHLDGWFMTCRKIGISQMEMKSQSLIGAINESKEILKNIVEKLSNEVNAFCEEKIEISR